MNAAARNLNGNWALLFTLEPSLVDVNIHPAKAEVRFRYPAEIYEAIKIAASNLGSVPKFITTGVKSDFNFNDDTNFNLDSISNSKSNDNAVKNFNPVSTQNIKSNLSTPKNFYDRNNFKAPVQNPVKNYAQDSNKNSARSEQIKFLHDSEKNFNQPQNSVNEFNDSKIKYLGQISSGYLIFDTPDELIIIDPHAAHERINYERIKNIASQSESVQHLLIPVLLHPTLALEVQEFFNELNANGFEIENTTNGLALKGIPAAVSEIAEPEVLLRMSLNALRQNHDGDIKNILWRSWATQACKMSVKLTSELTRYDALELWSNLQKCEQPFTCPHGRPVALKISRQDFAKHFGRE